MEIGSSLISLLIVLLFIILNGIFVAAEFAVIKLRRSRVEELVQNKVIGSGVLQKLQNDLDKSVAGAQLGITLASLVVGWLGEDAFASIFESILHTVPALQGLSLPSWLSVAMAFTILSALHIVLGEQVPKFLAIRFPESVLIKLGFPFRIFCLVTSPFIWLLNGLSNLIIRMVGLADKPEEQKAPSPQEFRILVDESAEAGKLDRNQSDILKRALELKAIAVADAMLPREEIDFLVDTMDLDQVLEVVVREKHSKFPVLCHEGYSVVGILNTKDLFDIWTSQDARHGFSLSNLVRKAYIVPDTMPASALLDMMKSKRIQIAMVRNQEGAIVGLVTLEDLVEQLVGEIWDEYDKPSIDIKKVGNNTVRINGDVTLFEFATTFGVVIECDGGCTTIAGVLAERLGHAPKVGDSVRVEKALLQVATVKGKQVTEVDVRKAPQP